MFLTYRLSKEYRDGARKFVNMAQARAKDQENIICPCMLCRNLRHRNYEIVYEHLVIEGMDSKGSHGKVMGFGPFFWIKVE